MPEHVHVHAPHELGEPGHHTSTRERWLEIAAALLLSLATLGIAWSGYQAAKWSGLQARRYTQASTARSLANRASTLAAQDRTQDLLNFNRWLEVYDRRQHRAGRRSTNGGSATSSGPRSTRGSPTTRCTTPNAIPSPLREKNYVLANTVKADKLERLGDVRFEQGKEATENADDYVFVTVFFAVVLFFAGISLRFAWLPMRLLILGLGTVLLVYGAVRVGVAADALTARQVRSATSASRVTSTPRIASG